MTDYESYADFYWGLPYRADAQWALILTDEPATIKTLTGILKMSQTEAVDDFLEESCWSNSVPELVGHKGTAVQRLAALRGTYQLGNHRAQKDGRIYRLRPSHPP
jgi:hypothetical protein